MKVSPPLLPAFVCAALLLAACSPDKPAAPTPSPSKPASSAAPAAAGAFTLAKPTDAAALAKMVAAYPLSICPVSGDKLGGSMGPALDMICKQAGQPDRLVRFCCASCPPDFVKEPAKYLKMIDDALAAQAKK